MMVKIDKAAWLQSRADQNGGVMYFTPREAELTTERLVLRMGPTNVGLSLRRYGFKDYKDYLIAEMATHDLLKLLIEKGNS